MFNSFSVENFRCFDRLEISGFKRVNLISGKNGVGKTALLEALFLLCGAFNPKFVITILGIRGIQKIQIQQGAPLEGPLGSLFRDFDTKKSISLEGAEAEVVRKLSIRTPDLNALYKGKENKNLNKLISREPILEFKYNDPNQSFSSFLVLEGDQVIPLPPRSYTATFPRAILIGSRVFINFEEQASRFGKLQKTDRVPSLVHMLKAMQTDLNNLEVVFEAGIPSIQGSIGLSRSIAVPFMGGGISHWLDILLSFEDASQGIVLIDEIENGFHYSVLPEIWESIAKMAKQNNFQVFATTHSFENLMADHRVFAKTEV